MSPWLFGVKDTDECDEVVRFGGACGDEGVCVDVPEDAVSGGWR